MANATHSNDQIREELTAYIRLAKRKYEEARDKLIADIQTNPASAIIWSAEGMVKVQTEYEVWLHVEANLKEVDSRATLKNALDETARGVRRFFGSNSTSMFSNAAERAKAETFLQLQERLEGLAKHFGI